jgi:hypothetical protein
VSATVAALYIDPRGPYPALLGADMCWDETRDARLYDGPWPVVAHPPCGPWGGLRHLYRGNEHDCALRAVEQVRRFGGCLEHPANSTLWREAGLPDPGQIIAQRSSGGMYPRMCIEVEQCAWGHVARKRTWLYIVGIEPGLVWSGIRTGGTPTHWASGGGTGRGRTPPGIKVCSAQQRRRTPVAFAEWLISMARHAGEARAA